MAENIHVFVVTARDDEELEMRLRAVESADDRPQLDSPRIFTIISVTPYGNTGVDFFVVCR